MSLSVAQRNENLDEMAGVVFREGGKFQDCYEITKNPGYYSAVKTFQEPQEVTKGAIINFQTRESTRTNASGVVALLIELEMWGFKTSNRDMKDGMIPTSIAMYPNMSTEGDGHAYRLQQITRIQAELMRET